MVEHRQRVQIDIVVPGIEDEEEALQLAKIAASNAGCIQVFDWPIEKLDESGLWRIRTTGFCGDEAENPTLIDAAPLVEQLGKD